MYTKKCFVSLLIVIVLFIIFITGCQNQKQGQLKGVKERVKLEAEPEITVQLADGQEKKMKLEVYVTGVVAGEMNKDWPSNAYAAQAILARTFALKYLEDNKTDIISSSYEFAQEYEPEKINDRIKKAVAKTRGEVALYKSNYIKGWFHASAGGQTTTAKVGLALKEEEPPYIKSVKSPDQEAPDNIKNWSATFSSGEIAAALSKMGKKIGQIKKIEITDKDKTGRAIDLKFSGDNSVTVKAANFRTELDPKKLKSTMIKNINKEEKGFTFAGSGFGHGVGLSQWGAYAMAKDNKTPEDIVKYYYQDTTIEKVYE